MVGGGAEISQSCMVVESEARGIWQCCMVVEAEARGTAVLLIRKLGEYDSFAWLSNRKRFCVGVHCIEISEIRW